MTYLASGRVCGDRGNIFNSANAHTSTSQGTESALSTRAGSLGASSTSSTKFDVESGNTDFTASGSDVLSSQHGRVGRGLVTVSLDLHSTSHTGNGFAARKIGNVNEGVVEGGEDAGNAKDKLALFRELIL